MSLKRPPVYELAISIMKIKTTITTYSISQQSSKEKATTPDLLAQTGPAWGKATLSRATDGIFLIGGLANPLQDRSLKLFLPIQILAKLSQNVLAIVGVG